MGFSQAWAVAESHGCCARPVPGYILLRINILLSALLWIVGFASSFKDEALDRAAEQLRAEAEAISQALGARR